MHFSACRPDVATGATDRRGVDVGRVQLDPAHRGSQSSAHGTRTTAKIDDDGAWPGDAGRLLDEVLSAAAGDEDSRVHGKVLAAEFNPAKEVFEGQSCGALFDQPVKFLGSVSGGDQELGLVFSEDATGGTEPRCHGGVGRVERGCSWL